MHWDGELWGTVSTPSPGHPLPPTTLPHLGGRRNRTAHFSVGLFLRVPCMAPGGKPVLPWDRGPKKCCPLGTRGPGQACLLPRLLPQSGARAHALGVPSCFLSSQASISPHRDRGTLVLTLACCSCTVGEPASGAFPNPKANGSFSSPGTACCALPTVAPGERCDRPVRPRFSLRQKGC